MRSKVRRAVTVMAIIASGAVVLTSPNFACESFLGESAMTAFDFCFIFDCSNGMLGGTIDPCGTGMDASGDATPGLFVDCPDEDE